MTPRTGDIAAALAYQIKKEIAENYFGTRKELEEERQSLLELRKKLKKTWTQEVGPLLIWIYEALMEGETGRAFLALIDQREILETVKPVREDREPHPIVTHCTPPFAITTRGKYKNRIGAVYLRAVEKREALSTELRILQKKADLFNEELAKFQSCYNLLDILSFVKSIDSHDELKGVLGNNTHPFAIPDLEKKMILKPLDLSQEGGDVLPVLPPWAEIRGPLERIIDQAYQRYCPEIKKRVREGLF